MLEKLNQNEKHIIYNVIKITRCNWLEYFLLLKNKQGIGVNLLCRSLRKIVLHHHEALSSQDTDANSAFARRFAISAPVRRSVPHQVWKTKKWPKKKRRPDVRLIPQGVVRDLLSAIQLHLAIALCWTNAQNKTQKA